MEERGARHSSLRLAWAAQLHGERPWPLLSCTHRIEPKSLPGFVLNPYRLLGMSPRDHGLLASDSPPFEQLGDLKQIADLTPFPTL